MRLGRAVGNRELAWVVTACALVTYVGASASDMAPDEVIVRAVSWSDLRLAHRALSGRLDGVVAGAFTDKVAELFAERWTSLDELAALSSTDPTFGRDVLAAINEAVTQDRAEVIRANATLHCPPGHLDICRRLIASLEVTRK